MAKGRFKDQFIPLPKDTSQKTYAEILGEHGKELERQGKILNWTFGFIVAVLVVCFIAFIGFVIDAWRFHAEAYKDFTTTLKQINEKLVSFPQSLPTK